MIMHVLEGIGTFKVCFMYVDVAYVVYTSY